MRLAVIHAYSKDKGPMDIGHKMSMVLDTRKSNLEDNSGCDFIFGSLRHFITKCVSTTLGQLSRLKTSRCKIHLSSLAVILLTRNKFVMEVLCKNS